MILCIFGTGYQDVLALQDVVLLLSQNCGLLPSWVAEDPHPRVAQYKLLKALRREMARS